MTLAPKRGGLTIACSGAREASLACISESRAAPLMRGVRPISKVGDIMDQQVTLVIVAVISTVSALSGAWLTGWRQSRLEHQKWLRIREDEIRKEFRLAMAELAKRVYIALQLMQWTTWKAKHDSSNLTEDELAQYDREMKELWPNIVSARVLVAALNNEIHSQITPLILELIALDSGVAKAGILFRASKQNGIKALADYHLECAKFESEFITKIGDMLALEKVRRDNALDSLSLPRKASSRSGDEAGGAG